MIITYKGSRPLHQITMPPKSKRINGTSELDRRIAAASAQLKNKSRSGKKKKSKGAKRIGSIPVMAGSGAYSVSKMISSAVKSAVRASKTPTGRTVLKGLRAFASAKNMPLLAGAGAYDFQQNSLVPTAGALHPEVPAMHQYNEGATRISHREYLGDIVSHTSAFNMNSWVINPGDSVTFPWLSQIAVNYTEYQMLGCVFYYRSLAGPVTAHLNQGYVAGACEYNRALPAWTTKQQLENTAMSCSVKPQEDCMIAVECAPSQSVLTTRFIRTENAAPTDPASYQFWDVGEFRLAVGAMPDEGVAIAELWVTYDVALSKPRVTTDVEPDPDTDVYSWSRYDYNTTLGALPYPYANSNMFALLTYETPSLSPYRRGNGELNVYATADSALSALHFPHDSLGPGNNVGDYLIEMHFQGNSSATVVLPTIALSSNMQLFNCFTTTGDAQTYVIGTGAGSTSRVHWTYAVRFLENAAEGVITFSAPTLPTSALCCNIYIHRIADGAAWSSDTS